MRIVVIGAGGIGGYIGGLLAAAGEDVSFMVHGRTRQALVERGLTIRRADGEVRVPRVSVEPGPADVVLHTTKTTAFRETLEQALAYVGPQTLVVTVQNGVDSPDVAAAVVGAGRVVPGVVRVFTQVVEPGVIEHKGGPGTITLATGDGHESPVFDAFVAALERAGVTPVVPEDIWLDVWMKAAYVVPFGAVGALANQPLSVLRTTFRDVCAAHAAEIAAVGRARGVAMPSDTVEQVLAFMDSMPAGSTASMQRDIVQGRPSELDAQVGSICRMGDEWGVPTPMGDVLWEALRPKG